MARPMRNNVDYFPHSVIHGKKMFYLRDKFGNDGYSTWFILLEQLGKADYHYLDLKDEIQLMYLSSELKIEESVLLEIIELLVKFGDFDSDLWNEKIIFCQKFTDSIQDAYERRNNNVVQKDGLCSTLIEIKRLKSGFMTNNKPQSKVEETKVDKSRFTPPTLEQVISYCKERDNKVDAEKFIDFYTSKGWLVGKSKMKDWEAAIRNWEKSDKSTESHRPMKRIGGPDRNEGSKTYGKNSSFD